MAKVFEDARRGKATPPTVAAWMAFEHAPADVRGQLENGGGNHRFGGRIFRTRRGKAMTPLIDQRCFHHPAREAVVRCPVCRRYLLPRVRDRT